MADPSKLKPPLNFQQHLAELDKAGLLVRIDRPINKDTELQPLVRWQFVGGVPEAERRAFLFTNVVDGKGRRYDMPVAIGVYASSPQIYAQGMGQKVENIGSAWVNAVRNPIAPVAVDKPACQEVVITGDALKKTRRWPGRAAGTKRKGQFLTLHLSSSLRSCAEGSLVSSAR